MITKKVLLALSSILLIAGSILPTPALADTGKGWDVFNSGAGEKIPAPSEMGPSVSAGAGKGWDTFRSGAGEPIRLITSNEAASHHHVPGEGWDVYNAGVGEKL